MRILFIGDIVGKIGRQAISKTLPGLKKKYQSDLVVANAENLAHGSGVTKETLEEMMGAGVDFFTSGNHIWKKKEAIQILEEGKLPIIRPANYPPQVPGDGYRVIEVGVRKILIVNLIGRVFMKNDFDCPFRRLDEILKEVEGKNIDIVFVDFHAEATSETKAMGYYADGRVSAVLGTHTHIQTADEEISEKGTAYITDVGMVGAKDSILGTVKEGIIKNFLTQISTEHKIPESGACIVNVVYLEVNNKGQATKIEKINKETRN